MVPTKTQPGFALVLVLILVAMAVVLGVSYLSVASLRLEMSQNYQDLSRARYLAESGLEHGLYLLRFQPRQLDGTDTLPLGPFYLDNTADEYAISCRQDAPGSDQYTLSATAVVKGHRQGSVVQGGIRRTSSATVVRTPMPKVGVDQALLVSGGLVRLPTGVRLTGDVHVNGSLTNYAVITGNASATGTISDPLGLVSGTVHEHAQPVTPPVFTVNQYLRYNLDGVACTAVQYTGHELRPDDPLVRTGAVAADNVGGVVHLKPKSKSDVIIKDRANFTGTLVTDADVEIDGNDITLTAVEGFPAIVTTGSILISSQSARLTLNGLVVAEQGIKKGKGNIKKCSSTSNGAVLCGVGGYDPALVGSHVVNYHRDRACVYDFSLPLSRQTPQVTWVRWDD
jgi:Tfp pilus assembly protein PilV